MSEQKRPDTVAELRRIHAMITQALDGALERSQHFAQAGFPDERTRHALVDYVGCFGKMLHDHHLGEDEFVFPYFQERLLDVPFDVLTAHHQEMESLLEDIQAACDTLAGNGHGTEASQALLGALTRLSALWHPHIQLEEAQFTRQALDALWDEQEEAQFGKAVSEYMQQLVDPKEMQECQAILSGAG